MTNTNEKTLQVKHTCCGRIQSNFRFYTCGKAAKFERDGKHYCGTHDPVSIGEKNAVKNAAWKAEREAKDAARKAQLDKQAEIERRASCYDDLLEMLKRIELDARVARPYVGQTARLGEIARDAIAKATGE